MKQFVFFLLLLSYGLEVLGYKVRIFNTTPYTANFFAHTTLAGCCYGKEVGMKAECAKEITAEAEDLISLGGLCSLACWTYVDANVVMPKIKEAYVKRNVPFENESLGCGNARLFLYKNSSGDLALGNKAEYIADLNAKLKKLFSGNIVAPFVVDLKSKYQDKVKELGDQIGVQAFAAGNLGIGGITIAQNLLTNTLDYAKEYIKIWQALQSIKKSANQDAASKLETLKKLEQSISNIPKKDALVLYNQLIDNLKATIYLARLEIAAQNQDKTLLKVEMDRSLKFPNAPELAAEIQTRIEATQRLYGNTQNTQDDEDPTYEWWIVKLSKPLDIAFDNAQKDLCAIKNFIEKPEGQKRSISPEVDDLLPVIDSWRNNNVGRSYINHLKSLIDQKLKDKNWNCVPQ